MKRASPPSAALVAAIPLFILSARAITDDLRHPWSHVWVPFAIVVVLDVRRLLHRRNGEVNSTWHWFLLSLAVCSAVGAGGWEWIGRGAADRILALMVGAAAAPVAWLELRHVSASCDP